MNALQYTLWEMNIYSLPLFPLTVVVCPGGLLPLRIFEARYLDMVRNCLRNNTNFGVVTV
ncbi:MAG: LON peptidase substrate-binding domain-containing protein, partial [Methylophilaceae bacterium]